MTDQYGFLDICHKIAPREAKVSRRYGLSRHRFAKIAILNEFAAGHS
jgi:hypothetical protein